MTHNESLQVTIIRNDYIFCINLQFLLAKSYKPGRGRSVNTLRYVQRTGLGVSRQQDGWKWTAYCNLKFN